VDISIYSQTKSNTRGSGAFSFVTTSHNRPKSVDKRSSSVPERRHSPDKIFDVNDPTRCCVH
jgi:hypothetical protein